MFFCGGSCIEDVSTHLMIPLSSHPRIRTCSADTILRAIKELTTSNITYTSPVSRKSYDSNAADKMNELLLKSLISTGELRKGQRYDLDFDHQFIQTKKYDAKRTYKKFTGYSLEIAVIGDHIVGIENRDGNANVRFCQQHTLERIFDEMNNGFSVGNVYQNPSCLKTRYISVCSRFIDLFRLNRRAPTTGFHTSTKSPSRSSGDIESLGIRKDANTNTCARIHIRNRHVHTNVMFVIMSNHLFIILQF